MYRQGMYKLYPELKHTLVITSLRILCRQKLLICSDKTKTKQTNKNSEDQVIFLE